MFTRIKPAMVAVRAADTPVFIAATAVAVALSDDITAYDHTVRQVAAPAVQSVIGNRHVPSKSRRSEIGTATDRDATSVCLVITKGIEIAAMNS